MKELVVSFVALSLALWPACAGSGEASTLPGGGTEATSLVGRLLLPGGPEARGVEVIVHVAEAGGGAAPAWLEVDAEGRFSHAFDGALVRVSVEVGGGEVFGVDGSALEAPPPGEGHDLGAIDLRETLVVHRIRVLAAEGRAGGDARMAMFDGPPPVGPGGGRVSLGSRQFPSFALGSELEWLVPRDATDVHLLVERPDGPERGSRWRTGPQQVFGPFATAELPAEVAVE